MKVLLIKDVKNLGKAGEVKEVKDGYGKNFLIGKGFAKHATADVLEQHAREESEKKQLEADEIAELTALSEKLDKLKIVIHKKLGNTGHLYGAVTKDEIVHALSDQHGIELDKKHINSKTVIKSTGDHDLDFKLGHGLHATLHVEVIGD
ncbi:MAG: 50S ribosomal protein L9 [Helicobacteraceae bacterium 4484_230]|nr:MAG: 50S ribosomal protein L9 [Helicobacteraceae bacterium 4484_230]